MSAPRVADLRCAVPDYSLPQFQPMTCGFPATSTAIADDGETVGICKSHEATVVASGYVLTRIENSEGAR